MSIKTIGAQKSARTPPALQLQSVIFLPVSLLSYLIDICIVVLNPKSELKVRLRRHVG